MGSRIKEEERIERMLRALLKLPENKRCINCNSLGPQYVCTTFLTFVCTNCSGVHREFTHRVKSVSMAKFNVEEVSSLQAGGNERARQTYFKEFDPQYHTFPDGSNIARLREFIKNVYVDRKYRGEKSVQNLHKLRLSDEPGDRRRLGAFHGGSRSFRDEDYRKVAAPCGGSWRFRNEEWKVAVPSTKSRSFRDQDWRVTAPYVGFRSFQEREDRYGRHYDQGSSPGVRGAEQNVVKYYYDERNSPRYSEENSRNGGFRRNPVRFEVVDNRIRDDRKVRSGITTPRSQNKYPEKMLPPMFRENTTPKHADGSAHNQKMKDGNAMEYRREKLGSLIDFNTDPEPSDGAVKSQPQQTPPPDNDYNWASFESSTKDNAPEVPKPDTLEAPPPVPKPDTLEALLLELSPISVPATTSEDPSKADARSTTCTNNTPAGGAAPVAPAEQMITLFDTAGVSTSAPTSTSVPVQSSNKDGQAVPTSGGDIFVTVTDAQQLPSTQQDQSSISFAADRGSPSQLGITPVGASNNLSRTSSLTPNTQQPLRVSAQGPSQSMLRTQSLPVETKFSNREELPEDFFAGHYSSIPSQASVCPPGPTHGMVFNMQYYPNIATGPAFPGPRKPVNPFDINYDKPSGHSTHFPSMSSLEEALHNASVPPSLMHTFSLGSFPSHLPPQSPKQDSLLPSHSLPPFAASSHNPYMGEQLQNNPQLLRPIGMGGYSSDDGAAFGTLGTSQQPFQQLSFTYPAPSNSETFSSTGGNPFG